MKERPIIFSGPMVRAILDGKKTQTRRAIKASGPWDVFEGRDMDPWPLRGPGQGARVPCPYGFPGDRLWVREALWVSECGKWFMHEGDTTRSDVFNEERRYIHEPSAGEYPAARYLIGGWSNQGGSVGRGGRQRWIPAFDVTLLECDTSKKLEPWTGNTVVGRETACFRKHKPPIFMPRWASRLTLEVAAVRVERLNDISEADARAEGVQSDTEALSALSHLRGADAARAVPSRLRSARDSFRDLWDGINGKRAPWASSPWVWVVEFKRAA